VEPATSTLPKVSTILINNCILPLSLIVVISAAIVDGIDNMKENEKPAKKRAIAKLYISNMK